MTSVVSCRDLIGRALRKINVLPSGESIPADQARDALIVLQSLYQEMVGSGAFGRMNDTIVTDATYTAKEQDRILCNNSDGVTVTLPDQITDSDFPGNITSSGTWPSILPSSGAWDYGATYSATLRPPLDGACIVITDLNSAFHQTYIYESVLGSWALIDDLTLDSIAPLSYRFGDGWAALIARRMAGEFGGTLSQGDAMAASRCEYAISHRYDRASRNVQVPYL